MTEPAPAATDQRMDQVLGNLLRVGVILASVVVSIGGAMYLVRYGSDHRELTEFHGERPGLTNVVGIIEEALALRRAGVIQLGILLLIATPIARVVFSVVAFAVQRDWTYVIVTLIVLAVLLFSLFQG
ncbi:MAG: DUF1634 domain-containing protein [Gemmataceae bacterium]|nr:DUF1634 domain-containing protein [Gemmataceae bacterium]